MSTRTLTVYLEVVPDRRSYWQRLRIGRTWTTAPTEHAGRVIRVDLRIPLDFLDTPDVLIELNVPADPPATVVAELQVDTRGPR